MCAAAFFRNKGKDVITEKGFAMGISMDLRWMNYSDAQKVLAAMMSEKILVKSGDFLKPNFKISDMDVPVAYRPPESLISSVTKASTKKAEPKTTSANIFADLMSAATASGMEKREFISACNGLQKDLNIDFEAAGLIVL